MRARAPSGGLAGATYEPDPDRLRLCALEVLCAVAMSAPAAAGRLLGPRLLASLVGVVGSAAAADPLRAAALEALGNLAWDPDSRRCACARPACLGPRGGGGVAARLFPCACPEGRRWCGCALVSLRLP